MLTTYNRCPWAFQRCRQEETDIDLSQESLTSREVLQLLRKIEKEDTMLYSDTQVDSTNRSVLGTGIVQYIRRPYAYFGNTIRILYASESAETISVRYVSVRVVSVYVRLIRRIYGFPIWKYFIC